MRKTAYFIVFFTNLYIKSEQKIGLNAIFNIFQGAKNNEFVFFTIYFSKNAKKRSKKHGATQNLVFFTILA